MNLANHSHCRRRSKGRTLKFFVGCFLLLIISVQGAEQESTATRKIVRADDGLNLVCESRGTGKTALVFLHGWGGDRDYWKNQVNEFASEYRVIAYDQAGHSESGKAREHWTVGSLAADVESVAKAFELNRMILVGHSMGGPIALMAAKRMPGKVIGVIAVDTLQNAEFKRPEEATQKFLTDFEADFQGTIRATYSGLLATQADPGLLKWLVTKAQNQDRRMAIGLIRDLFSLDLQPIFKEANVPIRAINSSGGSPLFIPTVADINKKYADFEVVYMDGVGHYPMLEKPAEFNRTLRQVLGEFNKVGVGAEKPLVWPRFRGPNGSGVAEDAKPPVVFGPEKNLKWKVSAPSGLSSPIIAGSNLVLTALDGGKLFTIAYRMNDGAEQWRAEAPAKQLEAFHKTEGSPATGTAATDGKRIVSYFGSCGLFCYDLAGKELWKFEMPTVATGGDFGSGVSPIIEDDVVVLVRDETKNSKIIALDVLTGSRKWEQARLSPSSYCTPVIWKSPEGEEVVAAGHARMVGYDLKSGAEKWFFSGTPAGCIPSPIVVDEKVFFAGGGGGGDDQEFKMPTFDAMLKDLDKDHDGALSRDEAEKAFGGFFDNQDSNKDGKITRDEWDAIQKFVSEGKNSAFALRAGGHGDVTSSHLIWKKTKGLPWIASGLFYQGQYIMVKDGGIVTAYDAKSGDQVYQERVAAPGQYYASPVAASGRIYFTSLQDGTVTVVKAGGAKPEVLATNPKLGERTAATPAIANDALFIRTDKHLYSFAEKD